MSNKLILCALLFLLTNTNAASQSAKGHLLKNNGETIPATFVIPIFHGQIMNPLVFQNQQQILIEGNKFDVDLSEYVEAKFKFGGRDYVFRSFADVKDGVRYYKMRHLIQDGDIQLYRNYFQSAFTSTAVGSDFFLVDEKERSIPLRPLNFKKKLLKFFGNCPKLSNLVRKKKFKYKQLEEIVAECEVCFQ